GEGPVVARELVDRRRDIGLAGGPELLRRLLRARSRRLLLRDGGLHGLAFLGGEVLLVVGHGGTLRFGHGVRLRPLPSHRFSIPDGDGAALDPPFGGWCRADPLSRLERVSSADPRIDFATGARLRVWSRIWRYLVVVLLSLIGWFGVYGFFAIAVDEGTIADSTSFFVLAIIDPLIWLIAMGLLPFRRRIPATVAVTTSLLSAFSVMAATGPAQLAVVSNATHRRWRSIVASIVAGVIAATLYSRFVPTGYVEETPWWIDLLGAAVGFALPAIFGLYIGARRALISTLHERAIEAERERELQLAAAEAGERTRIAREMHDV